MKQTNEVKLTKEEVQANIVQMLQQVEYWQDVVDNWPSDAKYLILNKKENDDEETKGWWVLSYSSRGTQARPDNERKQVRILQARMATS